MSYHYTYKITFVDGFYYFGSRKSKVKPEEDVYWGSPYTHKDKWKTTMFFKEILCVYETYNECSDREVELIKPVYKTDPFCLNENCRGRINQTPEMRRKKSELRKGQTLPEETKQKISKTKKGRTLSDYHCKRISEGKKGVPNSEEHKQKTGEWTKHSIWINNGTINRRIPSTDPIPDGFVRGRIIRQLKNCHKGGPILPYL